MGARPSGHIGGFALTSMRAKYPPVGLSVSVTRPSIVHHAPVGLAPLPGGPPVGCPTPPTTPGAGDSAWVCEGDGEGAADGVTLSSGSSSPRPTDTVMAPISSPARAAAPAEY